MKNYRKIILILLFCLVGFTTYSQDFNDHKGEIGKTYNRAITKNVNSKGNDVIFQDIKRSSAMLYFPDREWEFPDHNHTSTVTILNTVKNTFNQNNDNQNIFILMAAHNFGYDDEDRLINNKINIGDTHTFYLSFDFENSYANEQRRNNNIQELIDIHINRLWEINGIVRVFDKDADIALVEVDLSTNFTLKNHLAFTNTYAAGWTLNPYENFFKVHNISHPLGDHKKIYNSKLNPNLSEYFFNDFLNSQQTNTNFYNFDPIWENGEELKSGSSGSAMFNNVGHVMGVLSVLDSFSLLQNSITLGSGFNLDGLNNYLDPDNTWISKTKGGYLRDLVPNAITDFDLNVTTEKIASKAIKLNALDFFRLENRSISKTEKKLGSGLITTTLDDKVYFSLYPIDTEHSNLLLYGTEVNTLLQPSNTLFKGLGWGNSSGSTDGIIATASNDGNSKDLKNGILQYLRINDPNSIDILLSEFNFDAIGYLQTNTGNSKVRAIKLPNSMPYNAKELFEVNPYENLWKSYKYPSSKFNSENLSISIVKIGQTTGSGSTANTVERTIKTFNNGGYLNLVNPHYNFGPIEIGLRRENEPDIERKIDISITLNKLVSGPVSYSVWIDYFDKDEPFGSNTSDYTYNFVNDFSFLSGIINHQSELLESGTLSNGNIINIENKELPYYGGGLNDARIGNKRLRIAVKEGSIPPMQDEYSENTAGEVEDYSIEITFPKELAEAEKEAIKNKAKISLGRGMQQGDINPDLYNPSQTPIPDRTNNPNTDNSLGGECENTNSCQDNIVFATETQQGQDMQYFDNTANDYIYVGHKNKFIKNVSFADRTINFKYKSLPFDNSNEKQIILSAGNPNAGGGGHGDDFYAIGIDDDANPLLLLRLQGQEFILEADKDVLDRPKEDANTELWKTATFVLNEGLKELYLEGMEVAELNTTTNEIQHNGNVTFGGASYLSNTTSTSNPLYGFAGNTTNVYSNFTGYTDELLIFGENLTSSAVFTLSIETSNSTSYSSKSSPDQPKDNTITLEVLNKDPKPQSDFSIYPNPAKDRLNILVEVRQEGPLQIDIYDMSGRQVCTLNRPKITQGHQLITLPVENLSSGNYLLKIRAGDVLKSEQVVVKN